MTSGTARTETHLLRGQPPWQTPGSWGTTSHAEEPNQMLALSGQSQLLVASTLCLKLKGDMNWVRGWHLAKKTVCVGPRDQHKPEHLPTSSSLADGHCTAAENRHHGQEPGTVCPHLLRLSRPGSDPSIVVMALHLALGSP